MKKIKKQFKKFAEEKNRKIQQKKFEKIFKN